MEPVAQKPPYRRQLRSVLIHKPMQREFTLVVLSLLIVSSLTIGFVIHFTIQQAMMGGGYRFGKISAYEVMSDVKYELISRVSLVLFVTVVVIGLFGIFFLHRIAGPVYRFRRVLRNITQGEIPEEFRLREGDFFGETAEELNRVLQMLRARRKLIEGLEAKLEEAIQRNLSSPQASLLNELKESLNRLV